MSKIVDKLLHTPTSLSDEQSSAVISSSTHNKVIAGAGAGKDGMQRASYERGIVYVHVNSPVLKNYFGDHQERLNIKVEKDAVAILADTILQCISKEMAKNRIDRGYVIILSDKTIETERQKDKIEYELGPIIHRMITETSNLWRNQATI